MRAVLLARKMEINWSISEISNDSLTEADLWWVRFVRLGMVRVKLPDVDYPSPSLIFYGFNLSSRYVEPDASADDFAAAYRAFAGKVR